MNEHDDRSDASTSQHRSSADEPAFAQGGDERRKVAPSFEHKGIGSSIFLTAAAAVVPMIIVGVAAITNLTGKGRPKGGRR